MIEHVTITIPWHIMNDALPRLEKNYGREVAFIIAGKLEYGNTLEFLHRSTFFTDNPERVCSRIDGDGLYRLIMTYAPRRAREEEIEPLLKALSGSGAERFGFFQIVRVQRGLSAIGWVKDHGMFFPVDVINVPGPGMLKLSVGRAWPLPPVKAKDDGNSAPARDVLLEEWLTRSDRLEGFMGNGKIKEGEDILLKSIFSSFALIGAGRMGLCLAKHLIKYGAGKRGTFLIVDPDFLEAANLDSMEVPEKAVGMSKADVVSLVLKSLDSNLRVVPVVGTLSDMDVVRSVAACDFIFICVDNVAARVQASMIAQMCNRVCFDLTGAMARNEDKKTTAGGEIRISILDSTGCSVCMSGIGKDEFLRQVSGGYGESRWDRPENWQDGGKAGSFKGIISMVAGQTSLLFLRLLQGRLTSSKWFHLDADGLIAVPEDVTDSVDSDDCLCCSDRWGVRGLGDYWFRNG
ncbi:MAG: ThiF family adenylyltransferase [Candidatus Aenigmarchaeota archaeon]|nr:ThiF family adenylyltransferase [Candidatus Aenigmarchaeota archaeon]